MVAPLSPIDTLLEPLNRAGLVTMLKSDGRLRVGPRERITVELRAYIAANLDELVASVALRQASAAVRWEYRDPMPHLAEDAHLWRDLLVRAHDLDASDGDGAYWTLLGARCMSAELYVTPTTWRLRSRKGCEVSYAAVKPYLARNVDLVTQLLRSLPGDTREDTPP